VAGLVNPTQIYWIWLGHTLVGAGGAARTRGNGVEEIDVVEVVERDIVEVSDVV